MSKSGDAIGCGRVKALLLLREGERERESRGLEATGEWRGGEEVIDIRMEDWTESEDQSEANDGRNAREKSRGL